MDSSDSYATALDDAETSADVMRVFLNDEEYTIATRSLRQHLDHDCANL